MFLMAFAICMVGCGNKTETEKAPKIIPVKVMNIGFSNELNQRNYVGTVEESFALSLSFSSIGTVERVMVTQGQKVSKGQLLATLNTATAQNAYDVSKSTLKQAQDAYDRLSALHEKGSLPDIKFIEVETGLEKAKSMEAISHKNLKDCKLYASLNGVIAQRSVEEGSNVMPGTSAFKIVSVDEVYVKVSVPENEIGSIKIGQPATVKVSALGDKEYQGKVDKKGIEANPIAHTYEIKIRLKNPQSEMLPGMVCKTFIQQQGVEDKKIVVPNKVVQVAPDGKHFVWIADGNIAKRRFIAIGSLTDYGITVEDGLKVGDQVIVEGGNKVSEGMQIQVK